MHFGEVCRIHHQVPKALALSNKYRSPILSSSQVNKSERDSWKPTFRQKQKSFFSEVFCSEVKAEETQGKQAVMLTGVEGNGLGGFK